MLLDVIRNNFLQLSYSILAFQLIRFQRRIPVYTTINFPFSVPKYSGTLSHWAKMLVYVEYRFLKRNGELILVHIN